MSEVGAIRARLTHFGASIALSPRRLWAWWSALTLPQLWVLALLACVVVSTGRQYVAPNDFWWHVRVGQWIVEHRQVPATDLFSFTRAGQPWAYQAWLMEVIFYLLLRAGGLPLMIFFQILTITVAYALLLHMNLRSSGDLRFAAMATFAAAAVGMSEWGVRPQTISFLFFALTLFVVSRYEEPVPTANPLSPARNRKLWCLPPIFALWANAHGGFVFGLGLLGMALGDQLLSWLRRQRGFPTAWVAITALSAAATLVTPLGLGMLDYVMGFVRHPITRTYNLEFMPPTVRSLDGKLFFAFIICWLSLLLISRYRPSMAESLRLLLFGGLALLAIRNEPWFAMVAAPTMAVALRQWSEQRQATRRLRLGRPALNHACAILFSFVAFLSLPWFRPYFPLPNASRDYLSPDTPVQAVAYLHGLRPGHVFHSDVCGSYMICASPEIPVFIDTRVELYPPGQWEDYLALLGGRYDWQVILDRYDVDTLLLSRETFATLIAAADASPGWQRSYEDEQAVIYQRRKP